MMDDYIYTSESGLHMLASRIRNYRINGGLTQQELADRAGISLRSLQRFENGYDIQTGNLIKLLIALRLENNLYQLIPDTEIRPSAYLREAPPRQRVRKGQNRPDDRSSFTWGDEEA